VKKRKKFDEGGSVMDKPSKDMRDPAYRRQLEREQALEASPIGPEDLIGLGLGKRALSAAEMATRPYVKNKVVVSEGLRLKNSPVRMPNSKKDITHAYRNMSKAEYEAAEKSGYFGRNPNPKHGTGEEKWWSGGDKTGKFGREWKGGEDAVTVRVPKGKLPENKAVRFKDVEKMKKGGAVKSASVRADGCAKRGKTRGKMV
jgi:hypothetical protein